MIMAQLSPEEESSHVVGASGSASLYSTPEKKSLSGTMALSQVGTLGTYPSMVSHSP